MTRLNDIDELGRAIAREITQKYNIHTCPECGNTFKEAQPMRVTDELLAALKETKDVLMAAKATHTLRIVRAAIAKAEGTEK